MEITTIEGNPSIAVMQTAGDIDRSNYETLVEAATKAYGDGVRHVILDLSKTEYISSAALVAMQRIIKMMQGTAASSGGWDELHSLEREAESGPQNALRILSPTSAVEQTLEMVGFKNYIGIYADRDAAVASFEA